MDAVFATTLLTRRINEGITVFDCSLESFDSETGYQSSAGPSTAAEASCTSSTTKSSCKNYSDLKAETLILIGTYKEHQLEFLEENGSKAEVWSKVASDVTLTLAGHGLPAISEKKCRTKMDALKRHYKNVKDSNKKSGNSKITWPYYDEMEELFGEQPWVQPLSTAGSNIPNQMDAEIKSPPSKRQKTLKDYCDQLIEGRKKREETREQHHQEKIAVMNRLTDVVAQIIAQTRQN